MKLLRYGAVGAERPGILDADGQIRDLSSHVSDINGKALLPAEIARLASLNPKTLPAVPGTPRLGPCVGNVGKFICIGLNYSDHAAEAGMTIPPEPIVFMKATSAINGPNDDVEIPRDGKKCDWEAELGFVIGAKAKYVTEQDALNHVAGYCIVNDLSERSFQMEHQGQWTKGKSHDTFGPIGPWLVTPDEVPDPQKLSIRLDVNGHRYQNGSTATMVYSVRYLIAYLSRFMTLHPGDVVATGTPPGVGMGQKPPVYLKHGDRISIVIDGLGEQYQLVVSPHETATLIRERAI
jgi:2-keto-4-pentenoate hydratase/2-oxohepta-3-ene-1,7-dioic acid hydratase in catechol pathway